MKKFNWRPEPFNVAKLSDDLWLEVICLTNLEIAGSPRNMFWHGLVFTIWGVELLNELYE